MFCNNLVVAPVGILISLFALSSWINASSIWVELPLMINILPEKWRLPSYLGFVIQCSNIAPVLYSVISKLKSSRNPSAFKHDITLSLLIISTSLLASILMAFFWDNTIFVAGQERSIALLCLSGIFSLASCTSSLVYLPYMARYPATYLSIFYFGQGLSGLVPGVIGLAQGLGSNPECVNSTTFNKSCDNFECTFTTPSYFIPVYPEPKFSIQTFLLIISCILLTSLISFYIMNFTHLKSYQILHKQSTASRVKNETEPIVVNKEKKNAEFESGLWEADTNSVESPVSTEMSSTNTTKHLRKSHLCFYLISVAILNLTTNGLIPATQSYTCLPYGDVVYTITVRLSSVIGSICSLLTLILPAPGMRTIGFLMAAGVTIFTFHFTLAFMSPHPPMIDTIYGPIIIVMTAILMTSSFSLVRVWIASKLHMLGGRKLLLWCGGATQLGSFAGASLAFVLINWFNIFESIPPC